MTNTLAVLNAIPKGQRLDISIGPKDSQPFLIMGLSNTNAKALNIWLSQRYKPDKLYTVATQMNGLIDSINNYFDDRSAMKKVRDHVTRGKYGFRHPEKGETLEEYYHAYLEDIRENNDNRHDRGLILAITPLENEVKPQTKIENVFFTPGPDNIQRFEIRSTRKEDNGRILFSGDAETTAMVFKVWTAGPGETAALAEMAGVEEISQLYELYPPPPHEEIEFIQIHKTP